MTETVLVALIAVLGTAAGAAVSPVAAILAKVVDSRSDEKSERIRQVATFALRLRRFASMDYDEVEGYDVAVAERDVIEQRFEVAKVIPRGAGNVDWFCEYAISEIGKYGDRKYRLAAADWANQILLEWARGSRRPGTLSAFQVVSDGAGGTMIV